MGRKEEKEGKGRDGKGREEEREGGGGEGRIFRSTNFLPIKSTLFYSRSTSLAFKIILSTGPGHLLAFQNRN